jgi:hypothetical protein
MLNEEKVKLFAGLIREYLGDEAESFVRLVAMCVPEPAAYPAQPWVFTPANPTPFPTYPYQSPIGINTTPVGTIAGTCQEDRFSYGYDDRLDR